jgi:hypothetical protein
MMPSTSLNSSRSEPALPASFAGRIGFTGLLQDFAKRVCGAYGLDRLESCALIAVGYEDFNFALRAAGKNFVAKVFASFRSEADCLRYIEVMEWAVKAGVATPRLLSNGDSLFRLGSLPIEQEIVFLARQAARIAQIPL